MMPDADDKLNTFLNKSDLNDLSLRQSDEEMWMDFIVAASVLQDEFAESDLQARFAKARHGGDGWAEKRLEEYRFGTELLSRRAYLQQRTKTPMDWSIVVGAVRGRFGDGRFGDGARTQRFGASAARSTG